MINEMENKDFDDEFFAELGQNTAVKIDTLQQLCLQVIVRGKTLSEEDKRKTVLYLKKALEEGINPQEIGFDDAVLARLVYRDNRYVRDLFYLMQQVQSVGQFCDETAGALLFIDPTLAEVLTENCLKFASCGDSPTGVMLAIALLRQDKKREAMAIFHILAEKGVLTEAIIFLHRILEYMKGDEDAVLHLLQKNLHIVCGEKKENEGHLLYVREIYNRAVRVLVECGYAEFEKILADDMVEYFTLARENIKKDYRVCEVRNNPVIEDKMPLDMPETADEVEDAVAEEVAEELPVKETIVLEDKMPLDMPEIADEVEEEVAEELSVKETIVLEDKMPLDMPEMADEVVTEEVAEELPVKETIVLEDKMPLDMPEIADEVEKEEVTEEVLVEQSAENIGNDIVAENGGFEAYLAEERSLSVAKDETITFPKTEGDVLNVQSIENEVSAENNLESVSDEEKLPDIASWEVDDTELTSTEANIDVENILNVSSKDVDSHFDKIKQITSEAVKRAEERAQQMKLQMKEKRWQSLGKVKSLVSKLKFIKKKSDIEEAQD